VKRRHFRVQGALDLGQTLAAQLAGAGDPTARCRPDEAVRATRTPDGPATLRISLEGSGSLQAQAWGPGADWALEHAAGWAGLDDDSKAVSPHIPGLAERARGLRLSRWPRIVEALTLIVLEQKVSGKEARRSFRNLTRAFSEPAPGPFPELWLPVAPQQLAKLPSATLPPLGVLERFGVTLREVGFRATRLEQTAALPPAQAEAYLRAIRGIGVWTARSLLLRFLAHPDIVPLGDFHLPHLVAYNLTGARRGDDATMLELLEPFRGQRGRVVQWIHVAGAVPPRRAPRMPIRPLPRSL